VNGSPDETILAAVVEDLGQEPEFLAGWLDAAPDRGDGVVRRLGLDERRHARLLLYRTPRPRRFLADVMAIAQDLEVDRNELAAGLRETVALSGLAAIEAAARGGGGHQATRSGVLAAAHDKAEEQVQTSSATITRVRERATAFWADVPPDVGERRDVEAAVAWSAPLAVVALPALDEQRARAWLTERNVPLDGGAGTRPLRGLLLASRGAGIAFVDETLEHAERRFTVAHELGHFLFDYVEPRDRVLREAPALIEVIDGWRPADRAERAEAILARVPLGLHTHLLERDTHGGAVYDVELAEDAASQLALELLSPWPEALDATRAAAAETAGLPFDERVQRAAEVLAARFALPAERAAVRAVSALRALGIQRGFFDR
jgi:hypothetical protein